MYQYVSRDALSGVRSCCSDLINQLKQRINNDGELEVTAYLVGSGARNMVTQNANEPIDLDYNLEILNLEILSPHFPGWGWDGQRIKEYIKEQFDDILCANGWGYCRDSTSVLTTKKRLLKGAPFRFSIDLAILCQDNHGYYHRLIHAKTGFTDRDRWYWNQVPYSRGLDKRIEQLKDCHLWNEVRDAYLDKKDLYLRRQEQEQHPSFNVYVEAVNQVHDKYFPPLASAYHSLSPAQVCSSDMWTMGRPLKTTAGRYQNAWISF